MRIRPRDVYGEPLLEDCHITLERLGTGGDASRHQLAVDVPPGAAATFETQPASFYRLTARATGYAVVGRNIDGALEELELTIPINPRAVTGYEWPEEPGPFPPGLGFEDAKDDAERGALLNIWAKAWRTTIGLAPAATFIHEITAIKPDRIYARMATTVSEALEEAANFDRAPGALHEPPPGFTALASYKSQDEAGNLQITLFRHPGTGEIEADIDIDKWRGFGHLIELIENIDGDKTNQVQVHEILVGLQNIDPGWRPLI